MSFAFYRKNLQNKSATMKLLELHPKSAMPSSLSIAAAAAKLN